jgi:hypothetical protein
MSIVGPSLLCRGNSLLLTLLAASPKKKQTPLPTPLTFDQFPDAS